MDRWTQGEEVTLVGKLPDNALDVTVSVNKVDGTPVIVDQPCQQIIISIFIYRFLPPDVGDYIWQMKGTHPQTGKLHTVEGAFTYGGWVDSLLKQEHLDILAKEDTVLTRATPGDLVPLAKELTALSIKAKTDLIQPASVIYVSRGLELESHSVTEFYQGKSGAIVSGVKFDGLPYSGAAVTGAYYKPDDSVFLSDQAFTEVGSTGIYAHIFSIPEDADLGVYKVKIKAVKSIGGGNFTDNFEDGVADGWGNTGATYQVLDEGPPQGYVYRKIDYGAFMYAYKVDIGNRLDFTYQIKVRMDSLLPNGNNASSEYVGVTFRYADSANNYDLYFRRGSGNIRLRRNGATLAETPYGTAYNKDQFYTMKVVVAGANIKCYIDEVLQIDFTDNNPLPAGMVGLMTYNSVGSWDDLDVVVAGVTEEAYVARDFRVSQHTNPVDEATLNTHDIAIKDLIAAREAGRVFSA